MSYSDYTVKVFRGNVWLYKFPNTRVFQVFNFVEGFATFTKNAFVFSRNTAAPPVIRIFPGYGITLMMYTAFWLCVVCTYTSGDIFVGVSIDISCMDIE